ncbi:MAG: tetrathionate reductase family octaheme c-type cytochrome [Trichlorobacter sp.]|uniref:tetrathionate reductase family octaheme c-type cytochrome n=1 Tax=Trichlorobacter sp. TaxID=2911007 RepID=UPI00256E3AEC|nr:tetrathionate reductase family octaheme c-type cytochrome [Trichlorobacter sp.]MDK9717647.1 tetrathionate reductase family octaheme c-type cytochrome [Trichlorobacter sp.]
MKLLRPLLLLFAGLLAAVGAVSAATDHKDFIDGQFKDGSEVTKKCLECHDKQAGDFIKTQHWNLKGVPNHVKGLEKSGKLYGKTNMTNNYCTTIFAGKDGLPRESCLKCHAGYGWNRNKFDHNDKTKIDCLVCHAAKSYDRSAVGCEVDMKGITTGKVNLTEAAKSVGQKPTLKNCGFCHFYGGGGDGVKHAGLDSTMETADRKLDVHIAKKEKGGAGLLCVDCHKAKDHKISGASSQMAHYDARVSCTDCHSGAKAPHKNSKNKAILDAHAASVACQTCHIPMLARGQATKTSWFWSDVGKNLKVDEQFDQETFQNRKGSFTWNMNFMPTYAWYNGKIERYMVGDKIKDPSKVVTMTGPVGDIKDKTAKIYPYKTHLGSQPMDSVYKYLSTFQQYQSLWVHFNWEKALKDGAQGEGLPYSGKYQFVKTIAYISAQHQVAPKEDALQCGDCHMGAKRMDWKALGYKGDPMTIGGRSAGKKK